MASPGVERAAADEPSVRTDEPVSYTPKLFKMFADNQRIDTDGDEMRVDFVLRVAHGQVNPQATTRGNMASQCAGGQNISGRSCGLRLRYAFGGNSSSISDINYIPTMQSSSLVGTIGAGIWAANKDQYFTIHQLISSGEYDYLMISVECDLNYTDSPDVNALGGQRINQYLFAEVPTASGGYPSPNDEKNHNDTDQLTNVLQDYPAYVYTNGCGSSNNDTGMACNGPRSFIGWDAWPALWSGGQANWGLVTDYGLNGLFEGHAPPNSFFVYWYNRARSNAPCSKNTSFYFQWLGLKNGSTWVPVGDLTPKAQKAEGQIQTNNVSANGAGAVSAANSVKNMFSLTYPTLLARQGAGGGLSPAQNSDGSINFKMAKDDQGLDGYFKLVTWPITTNQNNTMTGCVADAPASSDTSANPATIHDTFNPLYGGHEDGITSTVAEDQSLTADLINKGWTIDTAYYKYNLPVVSAPVIDTPANNSWSTSTHPTIEGTGVAGHVVYLYAEDPGNPISSSDPDNVDTRGRYVGQATVGPDGRWSIVDSDNVVTDGSVRYHAWQVEQDSGYDLTSVFSNIQTVKFVPPPVVLPALTEIPHTKMTANGELPTNSKVKIHGTVKTPDAGMTLKVYATNSATGTEIGDGHPTGDKLLCTLTELPAGQQDWTCEADPSFFLGQPTTIDTYVFQAYLTDGTNETGSSVDRTPVRLDMIPPRLDDNKVENGTLSGTATSVYSNHAGTNPEANAVMHVIWPGGATAQTTTDASGNWSIAVPNGLTSGNIQVYGVDVRTNETAIISVPLQVIPPAKALPFTGETSRLPWIISAFAFALVAIGFGLYLFIDRRMKNGKAVDDP